jgi:hypothetical protein
MIVIRRWSADRLCILNIQMYTLLTISALNILDDYIKQEHRDEWLFQGSQFQYMIELIDGDTPQNSEGENSDVPWFARR